MLGNLRIARAAGRMRRDDPERRKVRIGLSYYHLGQRYCSKWCFGNRPDSNGNCSAPCGNFLRPLFVLRLASLLNVMTTADQASSAGCVRPACERTWTRAFSQRSKLPRTRPRRWQCVLRVHWQLRRLHRLRGGAWFKPDYKRATGVLASLATCDDQGIGNLRVDKKANQGHCRSCRIHLHCGRCKSTLSLHKKAGDQ